ncbi:GDSL-like Lipase/Acylhydrolase-domain-containing protein [Sporodiniella umbellata]|nr:GDSL-like Lipase/Acylhydrolase-domain-containing protein [Sporodiniella umbellata]
MVILSFALLLAFFVYTKAQTINNVVVFGDSYSDVGNHQRLTNGPQWSENLAVAWDAALHSFAYSGAVCDNTAYANQNFKQYIPSIKDQVEMYYHQNLTLNPEETVFAIWIGVNDVYKISESQNQQQALKQIVNCISTNVRNAGRAFSIKKFIIFGVPPLEKMPYYANNLDRLDKEKIANDLNAYLSKEVENMNKHIRSLELDFMDIHKLLDHLVEDPESFNIKNVKDAYWDACQGGCLDDINTYIWWDKVHLTGGIHRLIADSIARSGSFATETKLPSSLDVDTLLKASDSKFRSPYYKAKKNTGAIETLVEKLKNEKEKEKEANDPKTETEETIEGEEHSGINAYVYFGITATLIVCIGFFLFHKRTKNRMGHLASLSGMLKKEDRGRFMPLRNIDSEV